VLLDFLVINDSRAVLAVQEFYSRILSTFFINYLWQKNKDKRQKIKNKEKDKKTKTIWWQY